MPKGKSKKFIDKNNSVTFHLVHRSQKDPLIADETAPQRVLVPVSETQATKLEKKPLEKKNRIEEQQKYGIYFDDDYDYLQHLKNVNTLDVEWVHVEPVNIKEDKKNDGHKLNLPSSVFASNVEEKVGLLNKAAPVTGLRLEVDPDIAAALDDDFNFDDPENELEDDFIALANAGGSDEEDFKGKEYDDEYSEEEEEEEDTDASSNDQMGLSDEERDEVCSLNGPQHTFMDEETKSRFTEYSMSSSVMRRNEQLSLLDEKFEQMYRVYDDNEIGALDWDEIEGHVAPDSNIVLECAKEFEELQKEDTENVAELMRERMKIIEQYSSSDEDDIEKLVVDARETEKWDCESILSIYSNIFNHPKLIVERKKIPNKIKVNARTGIPKNILGSPTGKLTSKALAQFNLQNNAIESNGSLSVADTMKSTLSMLSVRPKAETPEERKERKQALKDYRRERRIERKANKEAFKEEKKRQEKILLNVRQNVQGNLSYK
ncbi:hypothetical protein M0802_003482 [Mischocyttarus mexicanus]|nr:hypothetical protein M0802_003482 [Mischocyttarus mexicanus]